MNDQEERRPEANKQNLPDPRMPSYSGAGRVLFLALIVGTPVITIFSWTAAVVYLVVGIVAFILLKKKWEKLDGEYRRRLSKSIDYDQIIGKYIDLEWFNPDRAFSRGELVHLIPDGGFPYASNKVRGRNMMCGKWKGYGVRTAWVDYWEEGDIEYGTDRSLFKGQLTIVDAPTGFQGKLLAIHPVKVFHPDDCLTKTGAKIILKQTGLAGRRPETELLPGWEIYSSGNAFALANANREWIGAMRQAMGMHFMLIEENRVTFLGNYHFNTVDYQGGTKGTREGCERAMELLADEGLRAAGAVLSTKPQNNV